MKDTKGKNYQKLCLYIKCSHVVNGLGKQKNIKNFQFYFISCTFILVNIGWAKNAHLLPRSLPFIKYEKPPGTS